MDSHSYPHHVHCSGAVGEHDGSGGGGGAGSHMETSVRTLCQVQRTVAGDCQPAVLLIASPS